MRTRLRFKIIATLIILSLAALLGFQAYWLGNLYDSTWKGTEHAIRDAMKMADYKELFLRIKMINAEEGDDQKERSLDYRFSTSSDALEDSIPGSFHSLFELLHVLDNMESTLLTLMHASIDSIQPVSYTRYDSLLTVELKEKNIFADYTLRVMQMRDSVPSAYMQFTTADSTQQLAIDDKVYFDYPIQDDPEQFYRLYVHSPTQTVLRQMAGILVSSGLLLLLILLAFVYLLRTILRQKTVEELKTDFTNNVTHELKTPLAVAYAANDVLLNYSDTLTGKQQKYLNIIRDQLTRLTGMVEQILTLSVENRPTLKLNPEPVPVADLLPPLLEQHKLKTDKQIRFHIDVPPGLTITADRTHLYNMVSNLVENAVKYTDRDPVEITVSAREEANGNVSLSVSDNGAGISETYQKRVFDKFFRVPHGNLHNVKGYGLGLYYIKDMMERHHGTVTLESRPHHGSVFTLHFRK